MINVRFFNVQIVFFNMQFFNISDSENEIKKKNTVFVNINAVK